MILSNKQWYQCKPSKYSIHQVCRILIDTMDQTWRFHVWNFIHENLTKNVELFRVWNAGFLSFFMNEVSHTKMSRLVHRRLICDWKVVQEIFDIRYPTFFIYIVMLCKSWSNFQFSVWRWLCRIDKNAPVFIWQLLLLLPLLSMRSWVSYIMSKFLLSA